MEDGTKMGVGEKTFLHELCINHLRLFLHELLRHLLWRFDLVVLLPRVAWCLAATLAHYLVAQMLPRTPGLLARETLAHYLVQMLPRTPRLLVLQRLLDAPELLQTAGEKWTEMGKIDAPELLLKTLPTPPGSSKPTPLRPPCDLPPTCISSPRPVSAPATSPRPVGTTSKPTACRTGDPYLPPACMNNFQSHRPLPPPGLYEQLPNPVAQTPTSPRPVCLSHRPLPPPGLYELFQAHAAYRRHVSSVLAPQGLQIAHPLIVHGLRHRDGGPDVPAGTVCSCG